MNDLFTPSEIVLLHGDKFVHDQNASSNHTCLSDIKDLYCPDNEETDEFTKDTFSTLSSVFARDELASAFFSQEIYLLDKQTKTNSLYATLEKESIDWHSYSLENFIIQQIKTKTSIKYNVVFAWINQDSFHLVSNEYTPWKSVVNLVKKGMQERQLLRKIPKKSFNLFPYTEYELEQSKFLSDTEILVQPILDKVQKYKLENLEIWNFLLQRIKSGIQSAKKD